MIHGARRNRSVIAALVCFFVATTGAEVRGAVAAPRRTAVPGGWTVCYEVREAGALRDIDMLDERDDWAVGNRGTIYRFHLGSWSAFPSPTTAVLRAVRMVSARDGWAVGAEGWMLRYSGASWEKTDRVTGTWLLDIEMIGPNQGWIAGRNAILSLEGGTWSVEPTDSGSTYTLWSVSATSADNAWVAGVVQGGSGDERPDRPIILHFEDGDRTEEHAPTGSEVAQIFDVEMLSDDQGWAVGYRCAAEDCELLHYAKPDWHVALCPFESLLWDIHMESEYSVWVVGTDAIIRYSQTPTFSALYLPLASNDRAASRGT